MDWIKKVTIGSFDFGILGLLSQMMFLKVAAATADVSSILNFVVFVTADFAILRKTVPVKDLALKQPDCWINLEFPVLLLDFSHLYLISDVIATVYAKIEAIIAKASVKNG